MPAADIDPSKCHAGAAIESNDYVPGTRAHPEVPSSSCVIFRLVRARLLGGRILLLTVFPARAHIDDFAQKGDVAVEGCLAFDGEFSPGVRSSRQARSLE